VSAGGDLRRLQRSHLLPIGGTFIKSEAQPRVYWTKVSANTKVRIGHVGNTIIQLRSPAAT
jgi:hypothetical protein